MIDNPLLGIRPHLLIVMSILVKHPLKIRHALPRFHLLPYLTLQQQIPHQILIVVTTHHMESKLVGVPLGAGLVKVLGIVLLGVQPVGTVRETGGVADVPQLRL
jgi:hypothetical protein